MLGSTLPNITDTDALTLDGPGPAALTISGNNAVPVLRVGATLNLQDVTIANGNGGDVQPGGIDISFSGTLNVTNSTFSGNSASQGAGGAINALGPATVTNSTFAGNSAQGGGDLC